MSILTFYKCYQLLKIRFVKLLLQAFSPAFFYFYVHKSLAVTYESVSYTHLIEVTAVYNGSTYTGGMSVHVFRSRVYYDVGTPLKRAAVDRGREGVVHNLSLIHIFVCGTGQRQALRILQ